MTERPILMSAPMVLATLADVKSVTRRIFKLFPDKRYPDGYDASYITQILPPSPDAGSPEARVGWTPIIPAGEWPTPRKCPYGAVGDTLWVREAWTSGYRDGAWGTIFRADNCFVQGRRRHEKGTHYHAKELGEWIRWRPSIFLPRWASRITLRITDIGVERLQDITEDDAIAEGAKPWEFGVEQTLTSGERGCLSPYRSGFACLWDDINVNRATWYSNSWVWRVQFERIK